MVNGVILLLVILGGTIRGRGGGGACGRVVDTPPGGGVRIVWVVGAVEERVFLGESRCKFYFKILFLDRFLFFYQVAIRLKVVRGVVKVLLGGVVCCRMTVVVV